MRAVVAVVCWGGKAAEYEAQTPGLLRFTDLETVYDDTVAPQLVQRRERPALQESCRGLALAPRLERRLEDVAIGFVFGQLDFGERLVRARLPTRTGAPLAALGASWPPSRLATPPLQCING